MNQKDDELRKRFEKMTEELREKLRGAEMKLEQVTRIDPRFYTT